MRNRFPLFHPRRVLEPGWMTRNCVFDFHAKREATHIFEFCQPFCIQLAWDLIRSLPAWLLRKLEPGLTSNFTGYQFECNIFYIYSVPTGLRRFYPGCFPPEQQMLWRKFAVYYSGQERTVVLRFWQFYIWISADWIFNLSLPKYHQRWHFGGSPQAYSGTVVIFEFCI